MPDESTPFLRLFTRFSPHRKRKAISIKPVYSTEVNESHLFSLYTQLLMIADFNLP
jgi:hypothetical protein